MTTFLAILGGCVLGVLGFLLVLAALLWAIAWLSDPYEDRTKGKP